MKSIPFCSILLGLFFTGISINAQNEGAKPFMKITVKDGKIVEAEPYNNKNNSLTRSDMGLGNNSNPYTVLNEDSSYNPDWAIRKSVVEDTLNSPDRLLPSGIIEQKGYISENESVINNLPKEYQAYLNSSVDNSITGDSINQPLNAVQEPTDNIIKNADKPRVRSNSAIGNSDPNLALPYENKEKTDITSNNQSSLMVRSPEDSINQDKTVSGMSDISKLPEQSIRTETDENTINTEATEKGQNKPEILRNCKSTFDVSKMNKLQSVYNNDQEKGSDQVQIEPLAGWETIMTEGFEGSFPGTGWEVYAQSGYTDAYWDDQSYRSYSGSWSAWCADAGSEGITAGYNYPQDMKAWMVYGPFDLSDATDGYLSFMNWNNSESDYDFFKYMVSVDGIDYYGTSVSGNSGGWKSRSLDLKNIYTLGDVTGEPQVWIAFIFTSDNIIHNEGAYVDDIILEKYTTGTSYPDLQWSSMTLSTSDWEVGNSVTADLTEVNTGTASAGSHYTQIYLSDNDVISVSDIQLGADMLYNSIGAGGSQIQSNTFTVPEVGDGTYYLGAYVDCYDNISEDNETNNILRRNGTVEITDPNALPDLTPTSVTLTITDWMVGDNITADVTEDNIGSAQAGGHYTKIFLSQDDVTLTDYQQLGSDLYFSTIDIGSFQTQSETFSVPDVYDGTYYIWIDTDCYGSVEEENEENNLLRRTGSVGIQGYTGTPDLIWTYMTLTSEDWQTGNSITADLTIENIGDGDAGSQYSRIYLSQDDVTLTDYQQLGSDIYFSVTVAGETQVQSKSFTVPDVATGTYYLWAEVDYYNDVSESDENNNVLRRNGGVSITEQTYPDLHWTSMTLSNSDWTVGGTETLNLTVDNTGNASADSHYTKVYISDDDHMTTTDTQLGSDLFFNSISAGGSQTQSLTFGIPDVSLDGGTYYLGAYVDCYENITESNESNNILTRSGTVMVHYPPAQPDLKWTWMELSTSDWETGQNVSATLTVENIGNENAGSQYTRIYLSEDETISVSDIQLGEDIYYSSLNAGSSQIQSSTFVVPEVSYDGTYYLGAFVDYYNNVEESNESNNFLKRVGSVNITQPVAPDLHWSSMTLSTSNWIKGNNVTANLTVENSGGETADTHYSKIYLSENDLIETSDIQLGDDLYFEQINPDDFQTQSQTWTVPDVASGIYYLGAFVDCYDNVTESNESNNISRRNGTITINPVPEPDLIATEMTLSTASWMVGDNVTANLIVENHGTADASIHYTKIYLSKDATMLSSYEQLGSDLYYSTIISGGSQTQSKTFAVPDVSEGTYYLWVDVDFYDNVVESDETNNLLRRNGEVTISSAPTASPDLVWSSLSLSSSAWTEDDNVTADLTVENIGDNQAGAQYSRLYMSDNDIISTYDTQLGSDIYFNAINAGNSQIQSTTFNVPYGNGEYWIGAIVDILGDVPESDETNNGGTRTGQISITPNAGNGMPDLEWTFLSLSTTDWIEGNDITAYLTTQNSGNAQSGSHYSRIYLSTNNIISTSDIQLGNDLYFNTIATGETEEQSETFTVPYGNGEYWIGALIDFYDDVQESDESNNGGAREGQVTISPATNDYIDLEPVSIALNTVEWLTGSSVTAEVTEKNNGTISASGHHSRLLLSDNTSITFSDIQLGSDVAFGEIGAEGFLTVNTDFTVPDVDNGEYYIGIMTDVNDKINESDESNNIQYRTGTVIINDAEGAPDIDVIPESLTINEQNVNSTQDIKQRSGLNDYMHHYASNQMIIKLKEKVHGDIQKLNTLSSTFEKLNNKYKAKVLRHIGEQMNKLSSGLGGNTLLLEIESDKDILSLVEEYNNNSIVEYAEPNYLYSHNDDYLSEMASADVLYEKQWGLKNTGNAISYKGQAIGTSGEDINIESAWDIHQGSSDIIVAIIDDGIDPDHGEFSGKIVHGYDFVNNDSDPSSLPDDGHGNACAGIIAASNDGNGVVGVAPNVKIMPIKAMEGSTGNTADIIDGIYYAVDNGAKVISMSLGGGAYSYSFKTAINYAVENGVIVLASAGNDGTNNISIPHYPSSYQNCLSVGAMSPCGLRKTETTCDGEFWWGSNYGDLDFITPGTRIYTTDLTGIDGYNDTDYTSSFNGTSSACPFAAGVAALILSVDPSLTPAEVRQIMQNSAFDVGSPGYDSETGYGRLDASAALQIAQNNGGDLITIKNTGNAPLTISSIESNKDWLTTDSNPGPYTIHINDNMVITVNIDWTMLITSETGEISINSDDPDEPVKIVEVTANPKEVETYSVTLAANPINGGVVQGNGQYKQNHNVVLTASPSLHYTFTHWTEEGINVSSDPEYTFSINEDKYLTANFELVKYAVSANTNPVEGGLVHGTGLYEYGDSATLSVSVADGYNFVNWTQNGEVVSTKEIYSFKVTNDISLVANFKIESYNIIVTTSPENVGKIEGNGSYSHGQTALINIEPFTGYSFVQWKENDDTISTNPEFVFTVTKDRNITAECAIKMVNITAQPNPSESATINGTGTYNYGDTVNLNLETLPGHQFMNWTEDGIEVSTSKSYSFVAKTNKKLMANLLTETYDIVASSNPEFGGTVSGPGTYKYGDTAFLTANPEPGYDFINWTVNGTEISNDITYRYNVTDHLNIKANFSMQSFDVILTANPIEGGTLSGDGHFEYGSISSISAIPDEGYDFIRWTIDGIELTTQLNYDLTVIQDTEVTAHFIKKSYHVISNSTPMEGGSVNGTGTYEYNETAHLTAIPSPGYKFLHWTVDGIEVSEELSYDLLVKNNAEVNAHFEILNYVINVISNPTEGGTATGTGIFEYGHIVTLSANPGLGYEFINWTADGLEISTDTIFEYTVEENTEIIAHFQELIFDITTKSIPADGGTVTGAGDFPLGEEISLIATPSEGYHFVNWTIDGMEVSTEPTYRFNAYENQEVVANFVMANYIITISANPEEGGTVTGGGQYLFGHTVTITAYENEGYEFLFWSENESVVSVNEVYSFIAQEDRTIVANYDKKSTNIPDLNSKKTISIYPNPASEKLYVQISSMCTTDITISLFDINNRLISDYVVNKTGTMQLASIDISGLTPGIYFIKFYHSDIVEVLKFIKE